MSESTDGLPGDWIVSSAVQSKLPDDAWPWIA
jgi:hypothetical protein